MIGAGVLKGMWVTFKTYLSTYPLGRALLGKSGPKDGLVTIQYPDEKQQHAERFRYFPFLVYDKEPDNLRCVACKICEQECPPQCIHIVGPAKDEQGRPVKKHGRTYPVEFDIDTSICMSCRICVDVCPFDAIEMDNTYELSTEDRWGPLVFNKQELLKSAEYFQQIKPEESAVVEARLAPKRAKAAAEAAAPTKPAAPPAGAPSAQPAAPSSPPPPATPPPAA
jgi:NADH-quinone oxidoreductase subunit I